MSNGPPCDFHQLEVKFGLPLAPAFFPRPNRARTTTMTKVIKKDLDSEEEEEEEEADQSLFSSRSTSSGGAIEAVNQMLSTMLMKYIPSLGCVLLSYIGPPQFLQDRSSTSITNKSQERKSKKSIPPIETITGLGWGQMKIKVKMLGWRPTIGQRLMGKPTMSSPSHLSLIVYQTFNAAIPEAHLKPAGYYYDPNLEVPKAWRLHGNASQKGLRGAEGDGTRVVGEELEQGEGIEDDSICERGCWVDPQGRIVGGEEGVITFTAISLTITNDMISVTGSVLSGPFSIPASGNNLATTLKTRQNRLIQQDGELSSSSSSSSEDEEEEEEEVIVKQKSKSRQSLVTGSKKRQLMIDSTNNTTQSSPKKKKKRKLA